MFVQNQFKFLNLVTLNCLKILRSKSQCEQDSLFQPMLKAILFSKLFKWFKSFKLNTMQFLISFYSSCIMNRYWWEIQIINLKNRFLSNAYKVNVRYAKNWWPLFFKIPLQIFSKLSFKQTGMAFFKYR